MITVNEINEINVIASPKKGKRIKIKIERSDDEIVIELTKNYADWLARL